MGASVLTVGEGSYAYKRGKSGRRPEVLGWIQYELMIVVRELAEFFKKASKQADKQTEGVWEQ